MITASASSFPAIRTLRTQIEVEEVLDRAGAEGWTSLALLSFSGRMATRVWRMFLPGTVFEVGSCLDERLVAKLCRLDRLTMLGARGLNLGDNGAKAIATSLQRLTSLDLGLNMIGEQGANDIAASLHSLTSLDLTGNHVGERGAKAIAASLHSLTSLNLGSNQVGEQGANDIAASLHSLTSLNLNSNRIGEHGAKAIADSLRSLTSLDLNSNQIGEYGAKAIAASLQRLTSLDLRHNSVGDHGARAIAASLQRLASLDLGSNQVGEDGAKAIAASLHLTSLNLSSNQIGEYGAKAIAASLQRLTSLDLGSNQIGEYGAKAIAASLQRLTWLDLGNNHLGEDSAKAIATSLHSLTSLDLSFNLVGDDGATAIAASLRSLTSLDLSSNHVGEHGARAIAASLHSLTSLDLGFNLVGDDGATAIAASLHSLTSLDLRRNHVGEHGARAIANSLHSLTSLDLSNNQVGDDGARAIAASLHSLTSLDLNNNHIGDDGARAIAASLHSLTSLDLGNNQVADDGARAIAASLRSLTSLDLSNSHIGDHGARAIAASLRSLTSLDLSNSHIGDHGTQAIAASLQRLTWLVLRSNQVGDHGTQAIAGSLQRLTWLDLGANEISDHGVRAIAASLRHLNWLALGTNPRISLGGVRSLFEHITSRRDDGATLIHLELDHCQDFSALFPSELILRGDAQALIAAYRRTHDRKPLNELRLLVVGNEAVGKTSLIRFLVKDLACDPKEQKTIGIALAEKIEIAQWTPDNSQVRLNIWDFGGQEIMHGTHQYFLTHRSVYLVVLEARREDSQNDALDHWLRVIKNRGKESPVIVIVNKAESNHHYHPDEERFRREFPNIVGFVRTTCHDDDLSRKSIQTLRQTIVRQLSDNPALRHVGDLVPTAWLDVKSALELQAKQRKTVEFSDYVGLCTDPTKAPKQRITESAEQRGLLELLHRLGVVIAHGLDAEPHASPRVTLLDPNWLTQAIYSLLNSARLHHDHALFEQRKLGEYLAALPTRGDYTPEHYAFITDMMQHPEIALCFELPQQKAKFLVPAALPDTEPDGAWDSQPCLRFRYAYDLLPPSLVPRLIVEAHTRLNPEKPTVWKSGAVFDIDGCKVLIRANRPKKWLDVFVFGPERQRRQALGVARAHLERVHSLHHALGQQARVPLPDNAEVTVGYEHLLTLEKEEGPDYTWRPEGAARKYTVAELLEGVRDDNDRMARAKAHTEPPKEISVARYGLYGVLGAAVVTGAFALAPRLMSDTCKEGTEVKCSAQCPQGEAPTKLCEGGEWNECQCQPVKAPTTATAALGPKATLATPLPADNADASASAPSGTMSEAP